MIEEINDTIVDETSHLLKKQVVTVTEQEIEAGPSNKPYEKLGWFRTPSLPFLYVGLVLVGLTGVAMASREMLFFAKACESNMKNGVCDPIENQVLVANFMAIKSVVHQVCKIIGLSVSGVYGDKYGRRPVLIIIAFGLILIHGLQIFGFKFLHGFSTTTFLLADICFSITGAEDALMACFYSYISDIVEQSERKTKFSIFFAILLGSQIFGQVLGTSILEYGKSRNLPQLDIDLLPIYFSGLISLLMLLHFFLLPESLKLPPKDSNHSTSTFVIDKNTIKQHFRGILDQVKILWLPQEYIPLMLKHRTHVLRYLIIVLVLCNSMGQIENVMTSILFQYGILKFSWDSEALTLLIMYSCMLSLVALIIMLPSTNYILKRFFKVKLRDNELDVSDLTGLILAQASRCILYFGVAFATSTWQIYVLSIGCIYSLIIDPVLNSSLSKFFPSNKLNQVFSIMHLLGNLINIISSMAIQQMYKYGVSHGAPSLTFFVISGIYLFLTGIVISLKFIW